MAIQFVVEDGTGLNNSTSYVSEEYFIQYYENVGVVYASSDTTKAWLNEATKFVDNNYSFCGSKLVETQKLNFPRQDLYYKDCITLVEGVPEELKNAVCEIAHARKAGQKLNTIDGNIASKTIGPVSTTFKGRQKASDIKKQYTAANSELSSICQIQKNYVVNS